MWKITQNFSGEAPIICIGGANIDRKLYVKDRIMAETSNPVTSSKSVGGVARNIAENLGRLGEPVTFLTVRGADTDWLEINRVSASFMDLTHVEEIPGSATGSYTAVLDPLGDLSIALADMDIFDQLTPALLAEKVDVLKTAKCIVADLNCSQEAIEYLREFALMHQIPFAIIPVSSPKINHLPEVFEGVEWLIVNRDETETYFGIEMDSEAKWREAVSMWRAKGIPNVIVTNGKKGVMASAHDEEIKHYEAILTPGVVDVTGAGDSFCSAVIHSWLAGKTLDEVVQAGLVNSHKTIQSKYTVRHELSKQQLQKDVEELIK